MTMKPKEKASERIWALLGNFQVLDDTIYLDGPHDYGIHEVAVRLALKDLYESDPSLATSWAVYHLLDAVLSQALNVDPHVGHLQGIRQVSGNVGQWGPSTETGCERGEWINGVFRPFASEQKAS